MSEVHRGTEKVVSEVQITQAVEVNIDLYLVLGTSNNQVEMINSKFTNL
jgi:hypothetical protein